MPTPPDAMTMGSGEGDGPALRYYRSLESAWSGRFEFRVTDWSALWRAGVPIFAKVAVSTMAIAARLIGASTASTTLAHRANREFVHTTRVSKWGATLFETTEIIAVHADGRTFRMTGEQRVWPSSATVPYEADGEVDEGATRAVYRIPWFGTELVQRTRIVAASLELSQETSWSRAAVLLRRVGP